jgi:hypothetical protein
MNRSNTAFALVLAALSGSALAQQQTVVRDGRSLNNLQNSSKFNGGPASRSVPGSIPGNGNFAGIGRVKANVDMLSTPARNQNFATPIVPVQPIVNPLNVPTAAQAAFVLNRDREFNSVPVVASVGSGFVGDSTFLVSGDWQSRHWGVNFNLGQPLIYQRLGAPAVSWDPYYGGYVYGYGNPYYPPPTYGYPYGPYSGYQGYNTQAVGPEQAMPQMQPQQPAVQPTPLTDVDIAKYELRNAQAESAVKNLRNYLKTRVDDAQAMRMLAVALLETKHFDDAAAMFRQVYRTDPGLASEPIDALDLGIDESDLRRMVNSSVTYAHRVNSASSWLTVAALMQAEGRKAQAKDMLGRAEKLGLEAIIAAPMKSALEQTQQ